MLAALTAAADTEAWKKRSVY
jgi:alpha-amylase